MDLRTKLGEKQLNGKELGKQRGHITGRVSVLPLKRDGTKPPECRAGQPGADSRKRCFIRRSQTRRRLLQTQCGAREQGQLSQPWEGQRRTTKRRECAWLEPGSLKPQPVLPAHPGSLLQNRGRILCKGGKKARRPLSPACNGPSLNISRSRKLTSKQSFPVTGQAAHRSLNVPLEVCFSRWSRAN